MHKSILVLALVLIGCGKDEYPEEKPFVQGCTNGLYQGRIDPYFVEYIETVRTKILDSGRTDLDLTKLDWISEFSFVDFKPGTEIDVYGNNRTVQLSGLDHPCYMIKVSSLETMPEKNRSQGVLDLIIYHEIFHIWFHHKAWGIMGSQVSSVWTPDKVLEGIDRLLEGKDEGTIDDLGF